MSTLIQLKDITRHYTNGEVTTRALNGVSFDIDSGEFVAIMGPSGSGKSTLMHLMGFLDTFTSGSYLFDGKSTQDLDDEELAKMRQDKVGFVFQAFNLLQKSTVLNNVLLPTVYGGLPKPERLKRARKAINEVSLDHRSDHFSNQLSGGEKQRVAIARAVVNNPSIIFADEPTGNLDTKTGELILELLAELNDQGHTIVMVTHEEEAAEYASRIIRLRDGLLASDSINGQKRRGGYEK
jgi:putative ABC transport system ATP-binding protein